MTGNQWIRLSAALSLAAVLGCAKTDQANQSADSTARNLTLAPTESTSAMTDVPEPTPAPEPPPPPKPVRREPPPRPAPPPAPTSYTLAAGTGIPAAADDSITTRNAKPGDLFTATVSENIRDRSGHLVIPAGSLISGTIERADPAPNPRATGQIVIALTSVTVRGRTYTIQGTVDSKDTVMQGRGVTKADAAKVGGGAAVGAIAGRLLGGNKKGTIIGGIAGAAAGGAAATRSRDVDVVLPKGAAIHVTLEEPLTVSARN